MGLGRAAVTALTRPHLRAWAWAWVSAAVSPTLALAASVSATGDLGLDFAELPKCASVQLAADAATCNAQGCTLDGHADLRCDDLHLTAEHIHVAMDAEHAFAGAQAQGDVVLTHGLRTVRSRTLTLAPDRLQGAIEGAVLTLSRADASPIAADPLTTTLPDYLPERPPDEILSDGADDAPAASSRRPQRFENQAADAPAPGSTALTLTGNLNRSADGTLTATDATLTLCDCGPGQNPSWRLDAPWVRVAPNGRAVIGWPRLRLNLAGRALVPVTPPLLPIWWPLKPRAFGLLPPQISFLGRPWPTFDLPLFVPMGPSWDLTVSPGARGDWGWAPRLGLRLRGRPKEGHALVIDSRFTWDLHGRMAAQRARFEARHGPYRADPWIAASLLRQRRALTLRAAVRVDHSLVIWQRLLAPARGGLSVPARASLMWTTQIAWLSDDEVGRDSGVALGERVASYLPSRSQLLWRRPGQVALVRADLMLNLDSWTRPQVAAAEPVLSNISGPELATLQRLPEVAIAWPGHKLGPITLDGHLSYVRYAPTVARLGPPSVQRLHVSTGLGIARPWGPLRAQARMGADGVAYGHPGGDGGGRLDAIGVTDAQLSLPLVRRGPRGAHLVRPILRYRGLVRRGPWLTGAATDIAPRPGGSAARDGFAPTPVAAGALLGAQMQSPTQLGPNLDPYLDRRALQQVELGLAQAWQTAAAGGLSGTWYIAQPFDVRSRRALQPRSSLSVAHGSGLSLQTTVGLNLGQSNTARLRHLQGAVRLARPTWGISGNYLRAAADADTYVRGIYALAARMPPTGVHGPTLGPWLHLLQAAVQMRSAPGPQGGMWGSYALSFALPQPGSRPALPDLFAAATAQSLTLGYSSPCRCWGIFGVMSASPQNLSQSWRMHVTLQVGDVRQGS